MTHGFAEPSVPGRVAKILFTAEHIGAYCIPIPLTSTHQSYLAESSAGERSGFAFILLTSRPQNLPLPHHPRVFLKAHAFPVRTGLLCPK